MDLPIGGDDDVLSQRTRAQIFSWLADHRVPASTEKVAKAFDLHPNGVRRHLERMRAAGLLERSRSRGGRGRPGDLWAIAPGADPGGERPTGYADLARWLARAIPPGRSRLREVEMAGREIGHELAPRQRPADPVEGFRRAVASLGFRPSLEVKGGNRFVCRLENCPYREPLRENGAVVRALHRGIASGLLDRLLPEAELAGFELDEPGLAGAALGAAGAADRRVEAE